MIKLETVLQVHREICEEAQRLISTKGADYNRAQQLAGDTLFNMRVGTILGITDTITQGVLNRISDKFMRLISLTKDPTVQAAVKDESVRDTVRDVVNYVIYLYLFYVESRAEAQDKEQKIQHELERLGLPHTTS